LYLYLNQIYLGHGNYGVQAAARDFFAKSVDELTLAEAAMLAGLPPAPSNYSPHLNPKAAKTRQSYVLDRMVEQGYISAAEADEARRREVRIVATGPSGERLAPYFTEQVRQELQDRYSYDVLYRDGLKVTTTLDTRLQRFANAAVRRGVEAVDARQGYHGIVEHVEEADRAEWAAGVETALGERPLAEGDRTRAIVTAVSGKAGLDLAIGKTPAAPDPKSVQWAVGWRKASDVFKPGDLVEVEVRKAPGDKGGPFEVALVQEPEVQGALIALDPHTGAIRAMVGGYDFEKSKFNRAVQAVRQPGSAFKPIVYAAALDKGFTPATIVIDAPIVYDDPWLNDVWKPKNFDQKFHGPTTVRKAISASRNVVTIKVLKAITPRYATQYAASLGISSRLEPGLSLALGASGVTPLELTRAYGVFAAGGRLASTHDITRVEDRDGYVLETVEPTSTPVISPQTAYLMTSLLASVINEGTGSRARESLGKRQAAGKTGTTNNSNDAWFIGYTPDLVAGVWVGYDREVSLKERETGGRAALPIWAEFMKAALEGAPETAFIVP
ncbi:MAG: PBP1A family penicillin-binding protein, partial [Candidatus Methylomirabilis sp.]|nr:PBP1A family penicillin-binding protein [Deltaproteobacteria bacterium]